MICLLTLQFVTDVPRLYCATATGLHPTWSRSRKLRKVFRIERNFRRRLKLMENVTVPGHAAEGRAR